MVWHRTFQDTVGQTDSFRQNICEFVGYCDKVVARIPTRDLTVEKRQIYRIFARIRQLGSQRQRSCKLFMGFRWDYWDFVRLRRSRSLNFFSTHLGMIGKRFHSIIKSCTKISEAFGVQLFCRSYLFERFIFATKFVLQTLLFRRKLDWLRRRECILEQIGDFYKALYIGCYFSLQYRYPTLHMLFSRLYSWGK
jgi:hypothetical protein